MNLRELFKKAEKQSEENQTARDNLELIEELRKLETYRREFLGNVSHELKTPLFNIQGYVLTLLEGGLEDPQINRDYLEKTSRNIDRMIAIIEDLEVISRFESGEMKVNLTRFNISELAAEIAELLEIRSAKKEIRFMVEKGDFIVHADKDRIRQVLTNLMDNSIKYGNQGGETTVTFEAKEGMITTRVSDNGIGIKKGDRARVFERFYRVDKSRSREQGGSGLGLSIVKHILEAHGQPISVESKYGEGSIFTFSLKKGN